MDETSITQLVSLRRHLLSVLKLVETQLGKHRPVCRHCFYEKGLTDRCECDRRFMNVRVSA